MARVVGPWDMLGPNDVYVGNSTARPNPRERRDVRDRVNRKIDAANANPESYAPEPASLWNQAASLAARKYDSRSKVVWRTPAVIELRRRKLGDRDLDTDEGQTKAPAVRGRTLDL